MSTEYILSHEFPPNYENLVKKFGVSWDKGVTVTYGKTIYSKDPIPPHLLAHEIIHIRQQEAIGGAEIWWKMYMKYSYFRFNQELQAYREEYKYVVTHHKKHQPFAYLRFFATCMSSKQYDLGINLLEAIALIKNYGKTSI